jgi:hypothetical protein
MTILSAIGDIRRFESPKKLVGYAGLGAGVHDSGQKHREKGITKFGRKELRWALVEASWQAVRSNPSWRAEYDRLCKRKHQNQAIVAIAHKLLVTIWYLLNKEESYKKIERRRSGIQNVDVGMAYGKVRIERHDQSAICEVWIIEVGERCRIDTDRARWFAAADRIQGGSSGAETRAALETIASKAAPGNLRLKHCAQLGRGIWRGGGALPLSQNQRSSCTIKRH